MNTGQKRKGTSQYFAYYGKMFITYLFGPIALTIIALVLACLYIVILPWFTAWPLLTIIFKDQFYPKVALFLPCVVICYVLVAILIALGLLFGTIGLAVYYIFLLLLLPLIVFRFYICKYRKLNQVQNDNIETLLANIRRKREQMADNESNPVTK